MSEKKTLIVGAGAIGGTLAVLMKDAGYAPDVLEVFPGAAKEISEKGLHLTGAKGEKYAYPTAYASADELVKSYDYAIVAVKYLDLETAVKSILPFLHEKSLVVGMQNGVCTAELAELVGKDRAVGCMIGFGATKHSATDVEMTSSGEMFIGTLDGGASPELEYLCRMYNAVIRTRITQCLINKQYSKLLINCCTNSVAAITGKTLGEIFDDGRAQDIILAVAREGMRIAKAQGISVPKYGALLDYRLLMLSDAEWYNGIFKYILKMVGKRKYASIKPSTLQSLLRGEKTEIDIFNGYLVRVAAEKGVDVPVNALLTKMIREIENGEREMTSDNLDAFRGLV